MLHADHIVVMHDGRVVGQGTSDELWRSCRRYRDLVSAQSGHSDDRPGDRPDELPDDRCDEGPAARDLVGALR